MDSAVVVEDLRKAYGSRTALEGLSLSVGTGELVAVVGPNGAGKTTAMELLEGHRRRDAGRVTVLGFDPQTGGTAFRERIGIMLQDAGLDEAFSTRELLTLYAGFYPRPRPVDDVLAQVGLVDAADTRTAALSGGQRRRADLALALIGDPDLLFLDEPTTGFDPAARQHAWDVIDGLREHGTTVLLTTHYMEEAQRLADRVGVLVGGRLVALGTPAELAERHMAGGSTIGFRLPAGVGTAQLPDLGDRLTVTGSAVRVLTREPTHDLHTLTWWAVDRGVELEALSLGRPSLEEVYLDLVRDAERTDG
ncbi:ABC transporter ATP-binding protein [Pseudonocardia lacus]|uniref:ABC transporter ATP-binding protein n=1 Tax=Pseudonocardia lacus TaxID=2835865 RepID=UPI001BDBB56B|nr:ABC transporter ATP-binding protein [Pseudonocardia lacus]